VPGFFIPIKERRVAFVLSLFKLKMRTRHFSCNSNKAITADGIDCAILIESMYELYCMGLSHGLSFLPEDINQSQQYVPHRASGAAIWSWCDYLSSNLNSIFKDSSSEKAPFFALLQSCQRAAQKGEWE